MNPTSLQVNLLNEAEKPIETNVNMTFYDQENKSIKYNIIHTLNAASNPDTLFVNIGDTINFNLLDLFYSYFIINNNIL